MAPRQILRARERQQPACVKQGPLALLICALFALPASARREESPSDSAARVSADGVPQRLILALDGLPYDLVVEAQAKGLFRDYRPAARMVSTFPSLTDVAFSTIAGSDPPDGYQVMRFDRETNKVVGNTVKALSLESHEHLPVDSQRYSSTHRMLAYVASYHAALGEVKQIGKAMLASDRETFLGYVESTDMLMHVHGADFGSRFLIQLDHYLRELQDEVRHRTGRALRIDIVSDHGSTMQRGKPARLEKQLAGCGFTRSKRLDDPGDVAYSLAGIIGSVALSCDPARTEEVARCLLGDPAIDVVTFVRDDAVVVLGMRGEAEIRVRGEGDDESYAFRALEGDPLGLNALLGLKGELPETVLVRQSDVFEATKDLQHPDPLRRIWRAFHGVVKEPADVLASMKDGYEAGNGAVRSMAKMRGRSGTHGSLTRLSSLGVLMSNWRDVEDVDAWSAHDVLFGR